jgi:hypothetical protein
MTNEPTTSRNNGGDEEWSEKLPIHKVRVVPPNEKELSDRWRDRARIAMQVFS